MLESHVPTVSEEGSKTPAAGGSPAVDEFAGIPARSTRHPVLAAAAVALAAFLIFQIRHDIGYAVSSASPRDLGDARAFSHAATTHDARNRYVRLAGAADRESAVILDTQGSWVFSQFFRLLGTEDRVFVKRAPDPLSVELAERDVFTGRLVPFRELSFQASIRRHFSSQVSATHFLAPSELAAAVGRGAPATVVDRAGEKVSLAAEDELVIDSARPGVWLIELPADRFPDPDKASAAVKQAGGEVLSAEPSALPRQQVRARFAEDRRQAALAALADLDRRVRIVPARATTRVRFSDLRKSSDGFLVHPGGSADGFSLPLADIQVVRTVAPVRIPDDAWLLVEGDRPRDHLSTVLVAVLLLGFAAVNLLALRRS
jgi:hypothetical protein